MKTISALAAAMLLVTANSAAAVERFDCRQVGKAATIVEIDRTGKQFTLAEDGRTKFDRQQVCELLAKIAGNFGKMASNSRCTIAFGADVIAADYVATEGADFVIAIALNTKEMTLTAMGRIGTISGYTETAPCKRL